MGADAVVFGDGMKFPSPGNAVCIVWDDAETRTGWYYDDPPDFSHSDHITYGVLYEVTKEFVVVAQTVAVEDGDIASWLGHIKIPRGCIRRVERLG